MLRLIFLNIFKNSNRLHLNIKKIQTPRVLLRSQFLFYFKAVFSKLGLFFLNIFKNSNKKGSKTFILLLSSKKVVSIASLGTLVEE